MRTLNKICVIGSLAVGLFVTSALADVGSNNPTGTSGQFNGNVTTGCSYDPYTANATSSVTDLVVPGGVSTYPLAFTRTMTSRYNPGLSTSMDFGQAGNWLHNYSWTINYREFRGKSQQPPFYEVYYPDGRTVTFTAPPQGNNDPDFRGPPGVRERFEQIKQTTPTGGGTGWSTAVANVYLRLPDGGRVWFHVDISTWADTPYDNRPPVWYTDFTHTLMGIIDPYNLVTTIAVPANLVNGSVTTITEPAGRMLKISYANGPAGDVVIGAVQEYLTPSQPGRTVYYGYQVLYGMPYSALTSVSYPVGSSASYTYQPSNNTNGSSRLLLSTAVDPMYTGPMELIGYTYASGSSAVYGQLQSEDYFDGKKYRASRFRPEGHRHKHPHRNARRWPHSHLYLWPPIESERAAALPAFKSERFQWY